jgi:RNA polymerase sigma factor (sigma-70 family)
MATSQMSEVISYLCRTVILRDGVGLTDWQLLQDYLGRRDEAALATLVRRHGPMVWGVCRRVLRNYHDAEDAFQATFLVFVRKASSIASPELLANWLYGVAHQTALKARTTAAKRRARERQVTEMPEPAATEQVVSSDLQPLLDQELSRLPDKYRVAIVLCDLGGKTRKAAARQLGVPEGTLAARLARGRVMLAKRLARHGLAVSGGVLGAVLAENVASAGVPTSVVSSTIKATTLFAAGQAAATGAISTKVAALTEGVLKTMLLTKLKIATALLMALTLLGAGSVVLTRSLSAAGEPQAKEAGQPAVPKSIVGVGEGVEKVAWSPNGKFLAVLTNIFDLGEDVVNGEKKTVLHDHCTLMLWDVEKKQWMPTTVPLEPKVRVQSLAVSPDSKTLAFGLYDLRGASRFDIRLVDVEKSKEQKSFPFGEEQGAWLGGIVFTSNDTLAVWGRDFYERSVVKFFDVEKPKGVVHAKADRDTEVTCFAISSDGKSEALGIDSTIKVAKSGKKEVASLEGHSKPIFALAFSPNATFLVSGSYDNTINVWDLSNDQLLHTLTTHDQSLNAVALSPDGKTVAMGSVIRKDEKITGQEVRLFDVQTGNLQRTLKVTGAVPLRTLAFSPDGRTLATGGLGVEMGYKEVGELRLWPLGK